MVRRLLLAVRRRIALKLTVTLVGFVAVSVLAAGVYLTRAFETRAVDALEARLAMAMGLLDAEARALVLRRAAVAEMKAFADRAARRTDARVTVIGADGRVLGDSELAVDDVAHVENHAGRPEVGAALAGRRGRVLRQSATTDATLLYVAMPLGEPDGPVGVLRLAVPLRVVLATWQEVHWTLLAGALLALAVALAIGLFLSARVTRPVIDMQRTARRMSEGDFTARVSIRSIDELGALGRALNVMALRLTEKLEDVERERAKASAVLDAMVEGVIAVDAHDTVLVMNERAAQIFDVAKAGSAGKPFLEVVRNAELHDVLRDPRRMDAGAVARRELRLGQPIERILEVNAVGVRLGLDGTGVVMVVHDVTALRRLEQVRTEFVANVSHELRTPLTAIHGYLETLLGGALEDARHARPFLEIVFRHTERLGRLLDDLADLSNIELGRITLRRRPLALDALVGSVLAMMRPRADSAGIALEADLAGDAVAVSADHDRLEQILINLVDNAVKHTPAGGHVTVRSRRVSPGHRLEICVHDTGIGIPPADLPRITERFYRVDKGRSREQGGTGLGLAIVKHLVLAQGGELCIDSVPGEGTTVRFTLPAAGRLLPAAPRSLPASGAGAS